MKNAVLEAVRNDLETRNYRSAWDKGVNKYALDLLDELDESIEQGYNDNDTLLSRSLLEKAMLNGASDWSQYSWGGCSLIYDSDIAETLCCPSELKKTRNGERRPNRDEEWLDVQARALFQASNRIIKAVRKALNAAA